MPINEQPPPSLREVTRLVERFEGATIPLHDFHHREHLLVALFYASNYPPGQSLSRMRSGLQRVLAANGKPPSAYREDVTSQWMDRAPAFV